MSPTEGIRCQSFYSVSEGEGKGAPHLQPCLAWRKPAGESGPLPWKESRWGADQGRSGLRQCLSPGDAAEPGGSITSPSPSSSRLASQPQSLPSRLSICSLLLPWPKSTNAPTSIHSRVPSSHWPSGLPSWCPV